MPTDAEYPVCKIQDRYYADDKYRALSPTKKYKLKKIYAARENAKGASCGGTPPVDKQKRIKKIESRLDAMELAVAVDSDEEGDIFEDSDKEPSNRINKVLVCQAPKKSMKKVGFPANP